MNTIILAGGLGTRLHPITKDKYPKCMVDINGKPFLKYLLTQLTNFDIEKVILSVGHKCEYIEDYFGCEYKNMTLTYVREDEPLGTGGAIKLALDYYASKENNTFIVLNGDTFTTIDLEKMMKFHKEKKTLASMAVKFVSDISRFGHIIFDKNKKIIQYKNSEPSMPGYVNAGVFIINEKVKYLLPDKCSFEENLFNKLDVDIYAFEDNFDFIDIGVPEEYNKFVKQRTNKKTVHGNVQDKTI